MSIKKAVITAAARGSRLYPVSDTVQKAMLPIVDRDGITKPVIQVIAEEALSGGVEEVCIVCAPGDEPRYLEAFRSLSKNLSAKENKRDWSEIQLKKLKELMDRLHFRVQEETLGYGHAVLCAKDYVKDDSFLLLLGDHLYVSDLDDMGCAKQLISVADQEGGSVSAVNETPEYLIGKYGTLSGKLLPHKEGVYQVETILEKPSLSQAELLLQMPGLKLGYYLCIFGMHVLDGGIIKLLEESFDARGSDKDELMLTPSLQKLAEQGSYLALDMKGRRYDLSSGYGLFQAQLALGLAGIEKNEMLNKLVHLLAEDQRK